MKRILTIIAFVLLFQPDTKANMASPIRQGSGAGAPFTGIYTDVLEEKILIHFQRQAAGPPVAIFLVDYRIQCDTTANLVPMIFHAMDLRGDFQVMVDGKKVTVKALPEEFARNPEMLIRQFPSVFQDGANTRSIEFRNDEDINEEYRFEDLLYFETPLTKGEHTITVFYFADPETDLSDWVREFSMRYSLYPAKSWRSFGKLSLQVNAKDLAGLFTFSSNLGAPAAGNWNSEVSWNFDSLPANQIIIRMNPVISRNAQMMINFGPEGLALSLWIVLALVHFWLMMRHRKRNPQRKYSWVLIVGAILVPLIVIIFYLKGYSIVDDAIGVYASRHHGYNFLSLIFYPVMLLFYWLLMWLLEKALKGYMVKKNAEND